MTAGRTLTFIAALIAAAGVGAWVGPSVMDRDITPALTSDQAEAPEAAATGALADAIHSGPADATHSAPAGAIPSTSDTAAASARDADATLPVDSPALHAQLSPLLKDGADVTLAAAGFRDATQFASVVRAARNTGVPFVLLKHRVLSEGMSLAEAIVASQPDVNGAVEADRAVAEARSDIVTVAG